MEDSVDPDPPVLVMDVEEFDPLPDDFVWRGPGRGPATGAPLHDMDPIPGHDVPLDKVGGGCCGASFGS